MLDPDEMNAGPQPWLKELVADTLVTHLAPIRAEMDRILQDTAYLGKENMALSTIPLEINQLNGLSAPEITCPSFRRTPPS
jgi:hypothetical protein